MKEKLSKFNEEGKKLGLNESATYIWKSLNNKIAALETKTAALGCHLIRCAKVHTSVGGSAVETFPSFHAKPGMPVYAVMNEQGASPVTIVAAKAVMGGVEVTFSADPSNDHKVNIAVLY